MTREGGFGVVEGVIAAGLLGLLVMGLAQLANTAYSQQAYLADRQAALAVNLSMLEILSKREACQNSFAGRTVTVPQNATQIQGPVAGETAYSVGAKYGPENSRFTLNAIQLSAFQPESAGPPPRRGRIILVADLARDRAGFGTPSYPARMELLATVDASDRIVSCVAVGRDLNQPWILEPLTGAIVHFGNNVGVGVNPPAQRLSLVNPTDTATLAYAKAISFYRPSDARLKTITGTRDGLADLQSIQGVTFRWKANGSHGMGILAQELAAIMPEAVSTREDGILIADSEQLMASLVEAAKQVANRQRELMKVSDLQSRTLEGFTRRLRLPDR